MGLILIVGSFSWYSILLRLDNFWSNCGLQCVLFFKNWDATPFVSQSPAIFLFDFMDKCHVLFLATPTRREFSGSFSSPIYQPVKVEGPSFPTGRASQFWISFSFTTRNVVKKKTNPWDPRGWHPQIFHEAAVMLCALDAFGCHHHYQHQCTAWKINMPIASNGYYLPTNGCFLW